MKGLIISMVLLSAIILFTIVNAILIGKLFDNLSSMLCELPADVSEFAFMEELERARHAKTLAQLCDKWEKGKHLVTLTASYDDTYRFTAPLLYAREYFDGGEYPSYLAAISAAKEAFSRLVAAERLVFGSIL